MKKCIFHYPGPIQENPSSGSAVRPNRMLNALKSIGYEVEEVTGFSKERSEKIKAIKKNIKNGIKYDFVYSENTSMPTAMSDSDHFPRHPVMDEVFLRKCRKRGIPVGLFYRDAYWQFPLYKEAVKWYVPLVTIPVYKHELKFYRKCTDILFVPSDEFAKAIGYKGKYKELPPGGDLLSHELSDKAVKENIEIFYVGGIHGLYDITIPLKVISQKEGVHFTVCCSEGEWQANKVAQNIVGLSRNITVVHKTKQELEPYYQNADITMALFERNSYRDLAMPVKLFEYIGYGKPIIATTGTAAGRFVSYNDIGWSINYDSNELSYLLDGMLSDRSNIDEKKNNVQKVLKDNTWDARARTVVDVLTNQK